MKNYLKLSIIFGTCLIAIASIMYIKAKRTESQEILLLSNIEALAAGESDGIYCKGLGTVDCPTNSQVKVRYVIEFN